MTDLKPLRINEIFLSIQGEGIHTGLPMHFIRVSGCNLKCVYCDTPDHEAGEELSIERISEKVNHPDHLPVYITGGEPLLADGTIHLIIRLLSDGREVHLDTNGSLDLSVVAPNTHKIIDIKTPGSGAADSFLQSNLKYISSTDEIKFIVTSKDDFIWAIRIIEEWKIHKLTPHLIFQPAWGLVEPKDLAEWVKTSVLPIRLSLQIHKIIWGPDAKGV